MSTELIDRHRYVRREFRVVSQDRNAAYHTNFNIFDPRGQPNHSVHNGEPL